MNIRSNPFEVVDDADIQLGTERFRVTGLLHISPPLVLLLAEREADSNVNAAEERSSSTSGKMPFAHVDEDVQPLLWGNGLARSNAFAVGPASSAPWIERAAQQRLIARLEEIADGRRPSATRRVLVVGPRGAGRRSAVTRFRQRQHRVASAIPDTSVPVVCMQYWMSAQNLYESCVQQASPQDESCMAAIRRKGIRNPDRRQLAIEALARVGTRLLVIEKFHDYQPPKFSQARGRVQTLDEFADELGLIVIALQEASFAQPDEWPAQWREAEEIRLGPCVLGSEFSKALTVFERRLPLRDSSELARSDLAGRLHVACGGDLGLLWQRLVRLTTEALARGVERLDHDFIDKIEKEDREAEAALDEDNPFC